VIPIPNQGAFTIANISAIMANLQQVIGVTGNVYFLDPANGNDNFNGQFPTNQGGGQGPVKTLASGYALLADGNNDVLVLISNGTVSSTARLSSGFTWAKNAAHLVGMCSPSLFSQRARIAPTAAVTAFANFFTVTGNGCYFRNIQLFQGFDTGVAASIALTVSGQRNVFENMHIAGMGDAASAQSATSRCVVLSGGENLFRNCAIGLDTVARTVANANIEFSGGAARNVFENCFFPMFATAATALGVIVAAAAASDRFQLFDRCTFINAIKSGAGTAITGLATLAAAMGGMLVFRDLTTVGVTSLGSDATSKAQMYAFGPANSTSTSIAANPA
jgi:hypothetical protein